MRHLLRGVRSGMVLFRTTPAATLAGVIALALGIGFSSTMFSIVHGATRSLPFESPESVVAVTKVPEAARSGVTATDGLDFRAWQRSSNGLAALEAFNTQSMNLSADDADPQRVSAAYVTPSTFARLGITPARGRDFADEDARPGSTAVTIISDRLWEQRFARDPGVLGRIVHLDGEPFTVIGVMPARFGFPVQSALWIPFAPVDSDTTPIQVWARLAPGGSRTTLGDALTAVTGRMGDERPKTHAGLRVTVIPFTELETPKEVLAALYVLLLAVSGVLVIACVNVANLFVARAAARARDTAVRLALGANRRILLWEHTGEALVLAGLGCALGLLIASGGTTMFARNTSHIIEAFWVEFRLDGTVILFAVSLALASALCAALLPAWRSSRADVVHTLRDGGGASRRRIGRVSRVLVTGQVAFTCALLALTLLLGRSAGALLTRAWPFPADQVLSASVSIPLATLNDADARERLLGALAHAVETIPGVTGAITSAIPGQGSNICCLSLDAPNPQGGAGWPAGYAVVSRQYFATLGVSPLRGRTFDASDVPGAPLAAVVNESFVARHSPDRDPIGRQLHLGPNVMTIVGIVPDLMTGDIQDTRQDGVYFPLAQQRPYAVRLIARGNAGAEVTARQLREAVDRVDRDLPIFETMSVRDAALSEKKVLTVLSSLFGVFGIGAMALTAIGLYSVMSLLVAMRTREFGIRLALGATRKHLCSLVAIQGGRQIATGLLIGIGLGYALTKVFTQAIDTLSIDPVPLLLWVALALGVTGSVAIAAPTWAATRLTPTMLLRNED